MVNWSQIDTNHEKNFMSSAKTFFTNFYPLTKRTSKLFLVSQNYKKKVFDLNKQDQWSKSGILIIDLGLPGS